MRGSTYDGVSVDGVGTRLVAHDLHVTGCAVNGLTLLKGGRVEMSNCVFSRMEGCGVQLGGGATSEEHSSRLYATRVQFLENRGYGLAARFGRGHAALSACTLTGNRRGSAFVSHVGCCVELTQCVMDTRTKAVDGGRLHIK